MLKIIIINHHFNQDIDALINNYDDSLDFKIISPDIFAIPAKRFFPPIVFSADLEEYHKEKYSESRKKWAIYAKKILHDLYMVYPFNAIISPSDTFFYIRDVITASHELGAPFIVLQKEHYMSPKSLIEHSVLINKYFPFMSDYMTVCSEMSKKFWVMAGADPTQISVIGQPRFDFYKQPERWLTLQDLGVKFEKKLPVVLFFSYDLGAYFEEFMINSSRPWLQLREETEDILFDYAKKGAINLIIKPHPQQDPKDIEYINNRVAVKCKDSLGKNIITLEGPFDTRQLIVNADIVISFQTTALMEALSVNKKVIYTFWTDKVKEVEDKLLPYHKYPEFIPCATSQDSFKQIMESCLIKLPIESDSHTIKTANKFVENYQGIIDGLATKRFLNIISKCVVDTMHGRSAETNRKIQYLNNNRTLFLVRHILILSLQTSILMMIFLLISPFLMFGKQKLYYVSNIRLRLSLRWSRIKECIEALIYKKISSQYIVGRPTDKLIFYFRKVFLNTWLKQY